MLHRVVALAAVFALTSLAPVPARAADTYEIDPAHTAVQFSVRHMMISNVRGEFTKLSGKAVGDVARPTEAMVEATIEAASIDTRNEKRDEHLRSPDFFDVEKWPEIVFTSTSVEEVEERAYMVSGELTIRDVTRQVVVPLELMGVEKDAFGLLRAGFEGTRRINRRDFGLEWNMPLDSGGVLVSERISLEFEISAIKKTDEAEVEAGAEGEGQPAEPSNEEAQAG